MSKLSYYQRIISAYLTKKKSHLDFWHDTPRANKVLNYSAIGTYYMDFERKAHYPGPFDEQGIPLLDYHGKIGKQYNPIAVAQYGLGHYNLYLQTKKENHLNIFLKQADWLLENLIPNSHGVYVWNHFFDWDYYQILRAPWYSGLAQGQGISILCRAFKETGKEKYQEALRKAFLSFTKELHDGGVIFVDQEGNPWIEEYITNPPTHILNGFIWALWGVYDYWLLFREKSAKVLWDDCLETLRKNLEKFDIGYWSLYDLSKTKIKNLASPFYHRLHIVQLQILHILTKIEVFKEYSDRWERCLASKFSRTHAYWNKAIFKLLYF